MKKIFLSLIGCCTIMGATAQLTVDANGNVRIGATGRDAFESPLCLGSDGSEGEFFPIISNRRSGLSIQTASTINHFYDDWTFGVSVNSKLTSGPVGRHAGVCSQAYNSDTTNTARKAYGVMGIAGNALNGFNYGVHGGLDGVRDGAAIIGFSEKFYCWGGIEITGRYAGYFRGKVHSTDLVTAAAYGVLSDARLKSDIESLDARAGIDAIGALKPVRYQLKQMLRPGAKASDSIPNTVFSDDSPALGREHYGLLAQDVQRIFPELVYEDGNGLLSINYIELIPVMIQSIQELTAQVQSLQKGQVRKTMATGLASVEESQPALEQNVPNPFNADTRIDYYLPETTHRAALYICDMQGAQQDSYELTGRGNASITISGGSLAAGMYLYSLVADGQLIDTKRMILTK